MDVPFPCEVEDERWWDEDLAQDFPPMLVTLTMEAKERRCASFVISCFQDEDFEEAKSPPIQWRARKREGAPPNSSNVIRFLLLQSETIKNYYFFIFFSFPFSLSFSLSFFHFFHFCSSPFAIKLLFFFISNFIFFIFNFIFFFIFNFIFHFNLRFFTWNLICSCWAIIFCRFGSSVQ